MDESLIHGDERRIFMSYLVPGMLSMLAVSAYSFVDTFVVGQGIGADAVAAMGLGTPVVSLLYALGFLLGAGGAVLYTVARETGEKEKAQQVFSAAFWSAAVLWLVIGIFGNLKIDAVADFLGATAGNHALTVEYLRWILSLSGVLVLDLVMNNFMRNEGHPNVSMIATVTGTGLNIVLDFVFVLVFHWGMGGAASATCLASVISVAINLTYAVTKKTGLIPAFRKGQFHQLPAIMRTGCGSCVLEGAVAVISVVFLNFAGQAYSDAGVSAFSVLITFNLVVYSLLNGVAQSIQPLVSANYAVNDRKRVRVFVRYGLIASCALGAFFLLCGELLAEPLVRLFVTEDAEIEAMAAHGLRVYAFSFICMAFSVLLGIYFQSEEKPLEGLIILLGRSAALPIAALFLLSLTAGKEALWAAVPAGEAAAAVIAVLLYLRERRSEALRSQN